MPNGEYIDKVYDNLVQSGAGSFSLPLNEFKQRIETNPEYVQKVYSNLVESGAGSFTLSIDEFEKRVAGPKKKRENQVSGPISGSKFPELGPGLQVKLPKIEADETIVVDQEAMAPIDLKNQETEGFRTIEEFSAAEQASKEKFEKAKKVVAGVGTNHPDAFIQPKTVESFNKKLVDKGYTKDQADELTEIMLKSAERKYSDQQVSRIKSLMNTRSGYTPQQASQILFSASEDEVDGFKDYLLSKGYNIRYIDRAIQEKQQDFIKRHGTKLKDDFLTQAREKGQTDEQVASRMLGIGMTYLSPDAKGIAKSNVEYRQAIETLNDPELTSEDRRELQIRMGEIERMRDVEGIKSLYDPATGSYVDRQNASAEAIEYEERVSFEQEKLPTDMEKLANVWRDKYFQFKFIEDLYVSPLVTKNTGPDNTPKVFTPQELSSAAAQFYPGRITDDYSISLKEKYLDARTKFEAVNRAYMLNEDPAAVDRGFVQDVKIAGESLMKELGLREMVTDTDQQFVEGFVEAVQEGGGTLTEAQIKRYEKTLDEKVAEGVGASIPVMTEIAVTAALTEGVGTLPRIAQVSNQLKNFLTGKYGKMGELGYNLISSGAKGYAAFAPTSEEGVTGLGEGFAQGAIDTMNPEKFLKGKYGKLANLFVRTLAGGTTETIQEFAGDYLNNLDASGYDYNQAFRETFGRDMDEFSDKLAVIGITSALFSGSFNLATMKWAKGELEKVEQTDEVKEAQRIIDERIAAEEGPAEELKQEEVIPSEEKTILPEEKVAEKKVEAKEEKVEKIPAQEELKQEEVIPSEEKTIPPEQEVSPLEEKAVPSEKTVVSPEEKIVPPEEKVAEEKPKPTGEPKRKVEQLINEITERSEKSFEKVKTAGFSLNPFVKKVKKNQSKLSKEIQFDDPDVETRFKDAGKVTKTEESVFKKAIDKTKGVITGFRRRYKPLDPKKYGRETNKLRLFEDLSRYTQAKAGQYVRGIVDPLTPEQFEIMKRRVVVEDLLSGIDAGIEVETALPFGIKSKQQATEYLDKVKSLMDQEPAAKEAYEARQIFMKDLHDDLVANDIIKEQPGGYQAYYHRRTLEYLTDELNQRVLSGKKLTKSQKDFMKARTGSKGKDYSTNFIESEYKVVADAIFELKKIQVLNELMEPFEKKLDGLKKKADESFKKEYGDISTKFAQGSEEAKAVKALKDDFVENYINENKPEDFDYYQPSPGNSIFRQSMVSERIIERAIDDLKLGKGHFGDTLEALEMLTDKARSVLVVGGKKKQYLIPQGLAQAIEQLGTPKQSAGLRDEALKLAEKATRNWKLFVLLNPARAIKYNINNFMGDLDGLLAADPTILKKAKEASKAVRLFAFTGKVDATLDKAMEQSVIDSGFDLKELGDLSNLDWAKNFVKNDATLEDYLGKSFLKKGLTSKNPGKWYFDKVQKITATRENAFRYAAFLRALEKIDAGETFYWASDPKEIDAITDKYEKAGKLAREALGDYGNISQIGQQLRKHMIPFYSWMEVNTKRYVQLLQNASTPKTQAKILGLAAKRGVTKVAAKMMQRYIQLGIFTAAAAAWNEMMYAMFDEFDKEGAKQLSKHQRNEIRGMQLILGVDEAGNVRTLPIIGAFYDFLDWAGIPDITEELKNMYTGEQTKEKGKNNISEDLIDGPINKIVQGFNPFLKSAGELMMGKTIYPNWRSPRPIKDEYEYIARFFSLNKTYKYLFDKPTREKLGGFHWMTDLLVRKFDPEEAAYYEVKNLIGKQKGYGTSGTARDETIRKRREALYSWAAATRYGQDEQAEKFLQKYYAAGGTYEGLTTSVRNKDPLHQLSKTEKEDLIFNVLQGKKAETDFGKALSKREIELIKTAREYYKKTFKPR